MKTPRRSFVVEIKSKRRASKTLTKSIWGDADLKALAQEVDDKAPHLSNSNSAASRAEASSAVPPNLLNVNSAGEKPDEPGLAQATPSPAGGAETDAPQQQQIAPTAARIRAKRAPVRRTAKAELRKDKDARSETIGIVISQDEMAVLDAENKRLKELLAERLRAENLQLKKMLERFAAA